MTDREKVTQWLKICANGCEDGCPYEYKNLVYRVECKADLMSDALELLKEQEPVKPRFADGVHYTVNKYLCGACGHHINQNSRYCEGCGRAVKWDGC